MEPLVRKWYEELWDAWKVEVADGLFTDDYRLHIPGQPIFDKQAVKPVMQLTCPALPSITSATNESAKRGSCSTP